MPIHTFFALLIHCVENLLHGNKNDYGYGLVINNKLIFFNERERDDERWNGAETGWKAK